MSEFKNRIITISGEPASGKSTVIKKLKEDYEKQGYKVKIFSIGDMLREMALERGMTIEQFNKFLATNPNINIDKQIDSLVAKKGKQINSKERQKEIFTLPRRNGKRRHRFGGATARQPTVVPYLYYTTFLAICQGSFWTASGQPERARR